VELHNTVIASIRRHEADILDPWSALVDEYNANVLKIRELMSRVEPPSPPGVPRTRPEKAKPDE
jgi:hypothetical protein